MRSVEQQLAMVAQSAVAPEPVRIAIAEALGLMCAEDVQASRALPGFAQAAIDGAQAGGAVDQVSASFPGKPIIIAQTGAVPSGSKDQWIREMMAWAASHPAVVAVVYFNLNKEVDWRISSSESSAAALAHQLAERPCP